MSQKRSDLCLRWECAKVALDDYANIMRFACNASVAEEWLQIVLNKDAGQTRMDKKMNCRHKQKPPKTGHFHFLR